MQAVHPQFDQRNWNCRPILLKNSKLPTLAKRIAPMRLRHSFERPAGPTAIEITPASLCVTLRVNDATRATLNLQSDLRRRHV